MKKKRFVWNSALADLQRCFGPYRLQLTNEQLWRGEQAIRLTPKAFGVLRCLSAQPGQLVTKDQLFETVWPGVVVSDITLAGCIRELRQALEDSPKSPQYIETVHRRGYRFIGTVTEQAAGDAQQDAVMPQTPQLPAHFVGREAELHELQNWWEMALQGQRQLIFITGEAGIGKTTLVEAWLAQVTTGETLWLGRGQCIEQYGTGEAYLPLLEALGRLCRQGDGSQFVELLGEHAPSWLIQLPAVLDDARHVDLQRKTLGVTRERMLRELAQAVEVLSTERPLILVLEDLHWSDHSTLEFLASVARRPEPARLLVIGTYRPVEAIVDAHPLRALQQELSLHGQCRELLLEYLSEEAIAAYLDSRFVGNAFTEIAAPVLHQRIDGNPLFMVSVVDALMRQGVIHNRAGAWELEADTFVTAVEIPQGLRQLIERQIERLESDAQEVLQAGSVAGAEFSAAAVAAGLDTSVDAVERVCEALVRREQFIQASGTAEWPDGTVASRYRFLHALYQEGLSERLTERQRMKLHLRLGERKAAGYGEQNKEIAAELAVDFERGQEYGRAIVYLHQAGEQATRRSAHQEAYAYLTRGLTLLETLPDSPQRARQELILRLSLGIPLLTTKGYAAPEVEQSFSRTQELCQQVGEPDQILPALVGLYLFYFNRGKIQTAYEKAEHYFKLAERRGKPSTLMNAHLMLAAPLLRNCIGCGANCS